MHSNKYSLFTINLIFDVMIIIKNTEVKCTLRSFNLKSVQLKIENSLLVNIDRNRYIKSINKSLIFERQIGKFFVKSRSTGNTGSAYFCIGGSLCRSVIVKSGRIFVSANILALAYSPKLLPLNWKILPWFTIKLH